MTPPFFTIGHSNRSLEAFAGLLRDAQVALRVTRQPPVGEPADVAQLPEGRVELGRAGHAQPGAERSEVGVEQRQAAFARVLQCLRQHGLVAAAQGFCFGHNR